MPKILTIAGISMIAFAILGLSIMYFIVEDKCTRDIIFFGELSVILMGYILIQEEKNANR